MSTEQYAFLVEWTDPVSVNLRRFKLLYFPSDDTIELWDMKNQRLFLKRIKCEGITLKDIYIGALIKIFSRVMVVVGYADMITQTLMNVFSQKTFGILKPHMIDKKSIILKMIADHNIRIVNLRMAKLDETQALFLYEDCKEKELLPALVESLTAGPALIFELIGENAISRWLELVGPIDPADAKIHVPDTIRGRFGTDKIHDAVYISSQTLTKNLEIFFPHRKRRACELNLSVNLENSTCCIAKPHIVKEGKLGDVIFMIEQELGFNVTAMRMCYLSIDEAEQFCEIYKTIFQEYQGMVEELSSGPCVVMEITGSPEHNTPVEFRKIVGPHDPEIARILRPNTIRARFGKTKIENAIHVTDLPEDAILELHYFFKLI